jgi:hypothetical protein
MGHFKQYNSLYFVPQTTRTRRAAHGAAHRQRAFFKEHLALAAGRCSFNWQVAAALARNAQAALSFAKLPGACPFKTLERPVCKA